MRRVCSWCGLVMDEGQPGDVTTHGMCPPCYGRVVAATQVEHRAMGIEMEGGEYIGQVQQSTN